MAILIFVVALIITVTPVSVFYVKRRRKYKHYKKAKKQLKLLHQDIHEAKVKNDERRETIEKNKY